MKIITLLLTLFCASILGAQNLVNNPSFEDTTRNQFGALKADSWNSPTVSSPDILNVNHSNLWSVPNNFPGFQYPKLGSTYGGMFVYKKDSLGIKISEYFQNDLKAPLVKDSTYCLQFYMSLADSSQYAIKNKLGIYFSNARVDSPQVRFQTLNLTPQIQFNDTTFFTDTKNWTKINASFVASGGEQFMTIGRFAMELLDTLKLEGGGVSKSYEQVYYYLDEFYLGTCDSVPLDTPNGLKESVLQQQLKLYPNPTQGRLILENQSGQNISFHLYTVFGKEVLIKPIVNTRSKLEFSIEELPRGIYLLRVIGGGKESATIKILKE